MNLLVTGGCGFIGSHFVEHLLKTDPEANITNVDALTYAAHPDTEQFLRELAPSRYLFIRGDIGSPDFGEWLIKRDIDAIVNFAAESHVDRSILDPAAFVNTNVMGLQNVLLFARRHGNIRVVHVSTDEVYGSLTPDAQAFTELSPLDPNSPYAASKAAADLLAIASARTYRQDVTITRCTNNYGPRQFPEKLLPLLIANAVEGLPIPVYGDGLQVRDWIYVLDHCRAIELVLKKGRAGEVYNISASEERRNLDLVKDVLSMLGKSEDLIQFVGDRPAHDRRYGLSASRIQTELGWAPEISFQEGLKRTVEWYLANDKWWKKVRGKDYYAYYQANYDTKLGTREEGNR